MYNCTTSTWWNYSAAYRNTDMQNHHASPILLVPTEAAKNSSIDMRIMHSSLFLLPNWVQLKRQIYNHSSHKKWSKVTMQSLVSLHIFFFIYWKETFETWSYKSYTYIFLSLMSSRHLIIDRVATIKFSQTRLWVIEEKVIWGQRFYFYSHRI